MSENIPEQEVASPEASAHTAENASSVIVKKQHKRAPRPTPAQKEEVIESAPVKPKKVIRKKPAVKKKAEPSKPKGDFVTAFKKVEDYLSNAYGAYGQDIASDIISGGRDSVSKFHNTIRINVITDFAEALYNIKKECKIIDDPSSEDLLPVTSA